MTDNNDIKILLDKNKEWSRNISEEQPDFFPSLAQQQNPDYLWIGCSDSRVPANEIVGLLPGELFVHRNVANMVVNTDLNMLSVLQYAVDVLKVKHVILCGHYGCGGVKAALTHNKHGIIDNWILTIKNLAYQHLEELNKYTNEDEKADRLCELNAIRQVKNLSHTTIVQDCWDRNQPLSIHGWIYGLKDGILKDLNTTISSKEQIKDPFRY